MLAEPAIRCVRSGKDLEVLDVADFLAGVDVDRDIHLTIY